MKHIQSLRRKLFSVFAFTMLTSAFLFTACESDDNMDDDNMFTLSGNASGNQEVPAVSTTGSATLTGNYNSNTNELQYSINWTGLSGAVVAAHFHGPAIVGENAPPLHDITITTNGVTGNTSATITLADSTEQHLLSGKIYYNLHTALNPAGEVRAQVIATN